MKKPNILFMLADDLGWGDVSYHGSPIRTPNIDRLAQNGIELDQHYVCPLCTPTRVSLLTGRHPGRFGRHATRPSNDPCLPDGYCTLATMLHNAGYATALFGKWHLGSDPKYFPGKYGFDYSYGSLAGGVDPYTHLYKKGPYSKTWHRNGKRVDETGHATDLIANEAIGWIEKQKGPWFCYVPFTAVHTPIRAPEHWIDRYCDKAYDADPERDRSFKVYAGYASHMDAAVGRLVETLKRLDLVDETIVIFVSDNGAPTQNPSEDVAKYPGRHDDMPRVGSNYPLRGHKAQMYEGGIRVPAAIQWPGTWKPQKMQTPMHMVDWMPTIAGSLGITPDAEPHWDGQDMRACLTGEKNNPNERHLYWNLGHKRFAVQQAGWKLIRQKRDWGWENELYHLEVDPLEERNLAEKEPKKTEALTKLITDEHAKDDTARRPDVAP